FTGFTSGPQSFVTGSTFVPIGGRHLNSPVFAPGTSTFTVPITTPLNTTVPGFVAGFNTVSPVAVSNAVGTTSTPVSTNVTPGTQNAFGLPGVSIGFNSTQFTPSGIPQIGLTNSFSNPFFGPAFIPNPLVNGF